MCTILSITNVTAVVDLVRVFTAEAGQVQELTSNEWINGYDFPRLPLLFNDLSCSLASWGLIPSWVKDNQQARQMRERTLNAKSETMYQLPSFRASAKEQRCLLPVNGFFEYQHRLAGKQKVPHLIELSGQQAFFLGGIAATWRDQVSFSIVTMPANSFLSTIHNSKLRQPVIVLADQVQQWLHPTSKQDDELFFAPNDELAIEAREFIRPPDKLLVKPPKKSSSQLHLF